MERKREMWIDNVKVIACMLVLLGHLMQSMTTSNIVPANALCDWFDKTIYYFHVPLFFVCSGYLYQKISTVNNLDSWSKNVMKKLLTLGVPYFTFTIVTWLIKNVFSGAGNNEIDSIFTTLFLKPTSPYWYLYALFFVFLITPTFENKRTALIGGAIAVAMKIISILGIIPEIIGGGIPYCVSRVLSNEIWFVLGMLLCVFEVRKIQFKKTTVGIGLGVIFLVLSVLLRNVENGFISFLLGLMACAAVALIYMDRETQGKVMSFLSRYTMPIFLMHSIFAATLRAVFLKVGITNAVIHLTCGIAISIFGPVIVACVIKKTKYLEFFIYPGKFIKINTARKE